MIAAGAILVGVRSIFVFDYRASSRTGLFEANAVARCGDLIFVSYRGSVVMYDAVSRVVVEMCGVTREPQIGGAGSAIAYSGITQAVK